MFGRAAGIFTLSASALGASAFLIPANIAPADNNGVGPLAISPAALDTKVNAKQFALQLPCSECAFSGPQEEKIEDAEEDGEPMFWIQGGANNVIVNFTITEDGERLQVNGETIYPLGWTAENLMAQRIYVNQVSASTPLEDVEAGNAKTTPLEVTGSGVSVMEEEIVSPEGHMLIPIKHTIFELERQPVSLDAISIKILKTNAGELFIVHVETEEQRSPRPDDFFGPPPEEMPEDFLSPPHFDGHRADGHHADGHHGHHGPPHGMMKECKMLPESLCKLRNLIEDKIMGMKEGKKHGMKGMKKGGCRGRKHRGPPGGKLPGHIKPHFLRPGFHHPDMEEDDMRAHHRGRPHHPDMHMEEDGMRAHHRGRPHHMRPHGHHGHHRGHGHFMHSFSRGLAAVMIPTMAGVAVGMTVSLVGLVIGRLIGFMWIKFYRGGRRGYQSVRLEDDDVDSDKIQNEKIVVIEDVVETEPLPVYEEAPTYEETTKEQK